MNAAHASRSSVPSAQPSFGHRLVPYAVVMLVALATTGMLHILGALGPVWGWIEPLLGVFTALTAGFIWYGEHGERRVAALPRRLTVSFEYEGEPVYVEEQAFLAHEADARQLAQQIGRQANDSRVLAFDAAHIVERRRGPEPARDGSCTVYCLHLSIELTSEGQARTLRAYATGRAGGGVRRRTVMPEPAAPVAPPLRLFVRCGPAEPPGGFEVIDLPAVLAPADLPVAAQRVRDRLEGVPAAALLVKGPLALGVALGQVLEHVPCRIDYLQLDQHTKTVSTWWDNTRQL